MKVNVKPSELPCGGCKYCTKAHLNWSKFVEEVDDVVPLGKTAEPLSNDVYAALSWLFTNDEVNDYKQLSSEMNFTSLEISFADPDISIFTSTENQPCNRVCITTRTDGLAGIAYSAEELKELQKKTHI
jgi:hypothetical protein